MMQQMMAGGGASLGFFGNDDTDDDATFGGGSFSQSSGSGPSARFTQTSVTVGPGGSTTTVFQSSVGGSSIGGVGSLEDMMGEGAFAAMVRESEA